MITDGTCEKLSRGRLHFEFVVADQVLDSVPERSMPVIIKSYGGLIKSVPAGALRGTGWKLVSVLGRKTKGKTSVCVRFEVDSTSEMNAWKEYVQDFVERWWKVYRRKNPQL